MAGDIKYVKERPQDATTTRKGIVKLAGDLGGTAEAPRVINISPDVTINVTGGGTGADLSASGPGALVQASAGANVTVEVLNPARGGTGVNNGSRTLTLTGSLTVGADTTISGGGTLALAGFTLTVPTTGTVALLGTANAFSVGQTVTASVVGNVPITAIGTAGQTANLIETKNNSGTVLWRVNASGDNYKKVSNGDGVATSVGGQEYGSVSLGETYTVTLTSIGAIIVIGMGGGEAAVLFADYTSATVAILSDPSSKFVNSSSPAAGKVGVWKSAGSYVINIKNNLLTTNVTAMVFGSVSSVSDPA